MNNDNLVYKEQGMFTPDLHWRVFLSNNETIFYDHREDLIPCWFRLKNYVAQNNLKIERISLHFRSNSLVFPVEKAKYYFHSKAIGATACLEGYGSWGTSCDDLWKFGYSNDGKTVHITSYRVPELLLFFNETRQIEDCGGLLICSMY